MPEVEGPIVMLVHGAWHRPWCWHQVVAELERHGVGTVLVDLPSCRSDGAATPGDLHDDAAEIRRLLDRHSDVVLVAHSYGGIPATEGAAGHPAVRELVYVAAYNADDGETLMGYGVPDPAPEEFDPPHDVRVGEDGLMTVDPERAPVVFYHDCPPALAREAVRQLRPMSARVLDQAPRAIAWRTIPSTYIVCGRDHGTPTRVQRELCRRAGRVEEIADSGHSPFLSQPTRLAELIMTVVDRAAGAATTSAT